MSTEKPKTKLTWMKKAKDAVGVVSLVSELHDRLGMFEEARSHEYVHISDMTNDEQEFCPREFCLAQHTDTKRKGRFVNPSLRVTFDVGNAMHDLAREVWFRDLAVGDWECPRCGYIYKFSRYPKALCKGCGGFVDRYSYEEIQLKDPFTGVSGSLDLLIQFQTVKKLVLVEVKSIDKDYFKALKGPKAEHRARVVSYLQLVARAEDERADQINQDYGYVLYVSKSYGFKDETLAKQGLRDRTTPFREYRVEADDSEHYQKLWSRAAKVKQYKKSGTIPLGICKALTDARANQCGLVQACFSEKYGGPKN